MKTVRLLAPSALILLACGAPAQLNDTPTGSSGLDPKSTAATACTVKESGGTFTMTCPDGTKVTWRDGETGATGDSGPAGPRGADGSDGAAGTSITAATEYPGSHCIAGGISVWSNATQPASLVQYVCAGESGSSCSVFDNGNDTYTMTCTNGTNVTWDNQGSTSASPWVPGGVLYGSYTIENSVDASFLSGVTTITGNLLIRSNGLTTLSIGSLSKVGGKLEIGDNSELTAFEAPITSVSSMEIYDNPKLSSFAVDLQQIGRDDAMLSLGLWTNPSLKSFSLSVTEIPGKVNIGSTGLEQLSLSATRIDALEISAPLTSATLNVSYITKNLKLVGTKLSNFPLPLVTRLTGLEILNNSSFGYLNLPVTYATGVALQYNPALTSVVLPIAGRLGNLNLYSNTALTHIDLPATIIDSISMSGISSAIFSLPVTTVTNSIYIQGTNVETIEFPSLIKVGWIEWSDNASLTSIVAPNLTNVSSDLRIKNNATLCNSIATALADQAMKPYTYIYGNTGTCP